MAKFSASLLCDDEPKFYDYGSYKMGSEDVYQGKDKANDHRYCFCIDGYVSRRCDWCIAAQEKRTGS